MQPDRSTAEKIRYALEQEIFLGKISPGQKLDEQREATRFGVSRTPVREALHYLASAGLVTISARRGATVSTLTVPEIVEMLEVLGHLESLAARLAAENMRDDEIQHLIQIQARCFELVRDRKIDEYYLLAKDFHEAIYEATRNSYLEESCKNLRNRVFPYLRHQLQHGDRAEACLEEQQFICDSLARRDQRAAAKSAQEHIRIQQRVFSEFITALERTGLRNVEFSWIPRTPVAAR